MATILKNPSALSTRERKNILSLLTSGSAVQTDSLQSEISDCQTIALIICSDTLLGCGAIKRERQKYTDKISTLASFNLYNRAEIGYVTVEKSFRDSGLATRIVKKLLTFQRSNLFATTGNEYMQNIFLNLGFIRVGEEWVSSIDETKKISVWIK